MAQHLFIDTCVDMIHPDFIKVFNSIDVTSHIYLSFSHNFKINGRSWELAAISSIINGDIDIPMSANVYLDSSNYCITPGVVDNILEKFHGVCNS